MPTTPVRLRRWTREEYDRLIELWFFRPDEPEPDVAVVRGTLDDYRNAHPSLPALAVEVALSSLASDRERKGSLHARAGLPECWILNLEDRVLEVYREPARDGSALFGRRCARRTVAGPHAHVTPLEAPDARVPVADLLP